MYKQTKFVFVSIWREIQFCEQKVGDRKEFPHVFLGDWTQTDAVSGYLVLKIMEKPFECLFLDAVLVETQFRLLSFGHVRQEN
jgi:hypothetical protein